MFRLFLVDLLKSGQFDKKKTENLLPPRKLRNRRVYERFDVDHKHLTLMNDQDILLVRDISTTGFSTEVSRRGFQRMSVGDLYLCRIRYVGEIFQAKAKVVWKAKNFVGFVLVDPDKKVTEFFERLLRPLAIGSSMLKVQDQISAPLNMKGLDWYHSREGADLYIWHNEEDSIRKWILEEKGYFILWEEQKGISTGKLMQEPSKEFVDPWTQIRKPDQKVNNDLKQLATDIFMAIPLPNKEQLIQSIKEPL